MFGVCRLSLLLAALGAPCDDTWANLLGDETTRSEARPLQASPSSQLKPGRGILDHPRLVKLLRPDQSDQMTHRTVSQENDFP